MNRKSGKRVLIVLLLVLTFFAVLPGLYAASSPDTVGAAGVKSFLSAIRESSDQVNSFQATFTQEKQLAMFDRPVLFKGQLSLVRPDRLRWEFTEPVPSALVFNGNTGLRCNDGADPVKFRLSEDPVMKVVSEQLWLWLGGNYSSLDGQYKLEKQGVATLQVTPLTESGTGFIVAVRIEFNPETLQPIKVEIAEEGGDLTRLLFDAPVINASLPPAIFENCDLNE